MGRSKEFDATMVLHKAIEVFGEYGYEGTSLQELLGRLGIARQSLYDTYGTKRDLFLLALKRYIALKTKVVIEMLEQPGSVKEAITQIFHEAVRVLLDPKLSKECFIVNSAVEMAPHDEEISSFFELNTMQLEQAFYQALLRGEAQGEWPKGKHNLVSLARYFNHARLSLTFTAKSTVNREVLKDIVAVTLSVLDE
jgi:TetR/AcrR family transcriptional repressor of nem operon